MNFVVVRPPQGLSTAAVYGACCPAELAQELPPLLDALRQGDLRRSGRLLFNRLQSAAKQMSPWIAAPGPADGYRGLPGHAMSGSGSAYFGLFASAIHARRAARRLRAREIGCVVAVQSCV